MDGRKLRATLAGVLRSAGAQPALFGASPKSLRTPCGCVSREARDRAGEGARAPRRRGLARGRELEELAEVRRSFQLLGGTGFWDSVQELGRAERIF